MLQKNIFSALAIALLTACQPSAATTDSAAGSAPSIKVDSSIDVAGAAAALTKAQGELVHLETSTAKPFTAVVVRHQPSASKLDSGACSVQIVEQVSGQFVVVASNDHLLACTHAPTLEGIKESIKVAINGPTMRISEQFIKGNSNFKFERSMDRQWFLTEVSFKQPENNLDTGYVDIVTKAVKYPVSSKRIRFSDYDYDAISKDLVKKVSE